MPSLYLHIPFCEKKCLYCDFYSLESMNQMEGFLAALHREIEMYASYGEGRAFETIFFGGGTPSLMSPDQLEDVLSHLHRCYDIRTDAEITLETNPGTVTMEKLTAFRLLGVNRLSIGIQSFHPDELQFLSRIHTADEAVRCVKDAKRAGFDNFSIDLIYALPGQTRERWEANLHMAMDLEPPHVSAYGLIVEDGTPLARMVRAGKVSPSPAECEAELYEMTMEFMERNGFEHYEVSNYCRPGFRSRHNYNYWSHENYLGFGPSAHSFWRGTDGEARRWWNIANLSHYCDELKRNASPLVSEETLAECQLYTERLFLGLRSDGVDLDKLKSEFRYDPRDSQPGIIAQLASQELVTVHDNVLRLTARGYLLCDEICARLI